MKTPAPFDETKNEAGLPAPPGSASRTPPAFRAFLKLVPMMFVGLAVAFPWPAIRGGCLILAFLAAWILELEFDD